MKQNGFTLFELLIVVLLISIIFVAATPRIINTFNNSKKNMFITESKTVYNQSIKKYQADKLLGKKTLLITNNDNSLKLSNEKIMYCVNLNNSGKIENIKVSNGVYYVDGIGDFNTSVKTENVKDVLVENFDCETKLEDILVVEEDCTIFCKNGEDNSKTILKYLLIAFVFVIVVSIFLRRK